MPAAAAARLRHVLVAPQTAGNVGAAARALKNLGLRRLVVVAPECDPRGDEARARAVGAADLLDAMETAPDLDAALRGAGTVVGFSRRVGKHRKPHPRIEALRDFWPAALAGGAEAALVFGREDSGLTDRELDRCTHLAALPAADAYPSYNLAQAVLLSAYELHLALGGPPRGADAGEGDPPAADERREPMYRHLERALRDIGFVHDETAEPILRRFRRLLGRAGATEDEVRMLRGLARQMSWAAERAREADRAREGG